MRSILLALTALSFLAGGAKAAPVLLVSIDGLRPGEILEADIRGLKIPTLRALQAQGTYATGVKGVLPTLTYPSHTTILTGASPAVHGIGNNLTFDPMLINREGWYWFASDIKVPTLWDAAHAARLSTANVHWPVSVDASSIDANLPQIWRTGHGDDRKLLRALATPGLVESLERELGPYADGIDESVAGDELRGRFAERLYTLRKPDFMTAYFTGFDHEQHEFGPGTPQAHAALERIDAVLGKLVATARKARPDVVVVLISDHGFAPTRFDVNLIAPFVGAGLVKFDLATQKVTSWEAEPWASGGSTAVVLARPDDAALKAKVATLLAGLAAKPELGIAEVITQPEITRRGGSPAASFWLNFKPDYKIGKDPLAAPVGPSATKGMHGYFPGIPEMQATLIIAGPGLAKTGSLGEVDMRDIAPTIAGLLKVKLPTTEGKPLF